MKPVFIVVDGVDGAGKSTQVKLLAEWLRGKGEPAEITREPGGTAAGTIIRSVLVNKNMMLVPETELLLFCADRAEHQQKVRSMLTNGINVICDRFLPSTWAYQVFGRKLQPGLLEEVILHTVHTFPDLTLIMDMNIDDALKRAEERLAIEGKTIAEGRFESEKKEFFRNVREGFLWYASQERFGKSVIIDASGSTEEIAVNIQNACAENLNI